MKIPISTKKHKVNKRLWSITILALMITLILSSYQAIEAKANLRDETANPQLDGATVMTGSLNKNFDKNGKDGSGTGDSGETLNGTKENGATRSLSYLYWAGSTKRTGYIIAILE